MLENERVEFNALMSVLVDYNDDQEYRKKLIAEIQTKYPDYIKNINLEKL